MPESIQNTQIPSTLALPEGNPSTQAQAAPAAPAEAMPPEPVAEIPAQEPPSREPYEEALVQEPSAAPAHDGDGAWPDTPAAPGDLTLCLRSDTPSGTDGDVVLLIDGTLLGPSPVTAQISPDGEHFLTALPLGRGTPDCHCYGVTRALRFSGGALCQAAPDVDVYDWGGGLFEAVLHLPALYGSMQRTFPFTIAQLPWERQLAVLYNDDGVWLAVESSSRVLCGFPMSGAAEGELYTTMHCLVAVTRDGEKQEVLVLGPDRRERLRVQADHITVTDGCITVVDRLPTQRGHERRTRYLCRETDWLAEPPQDGFFTHEPYPADNAPLALLEALLVGDAPEALSFLSPTLRDGLDEAALTEFFGPFSGIRPFFEESGESVALGLTDQAESGVVRCRRFLFEIGADLSVANITEES